MSCSTATCLVGASRLLKEGGLVSMSDPIVTRGGLVILEVEHAVPEGSSITLGCEPAAAAAAAKAAVEGMM